jgi:hypothetical protein
MDEDEHGRRGVELQTALMGSREGSAKKELARDYGRRSGGNQLWHSIERSYFSSVVCCDAPYGASQQYFYDS